MTQRQPCLMCGQPYLNADSLVKHYAREHGARTTLEIYGRVCPHCGKDFQRLDSHATRTHHRPLALLFADMSHSDPHGVVQARRATLAATDLTTISRDLAGLEADLKAFDPGSTHR